MAKFEHRKYPALTLQDAVGVWARFSPEERHFGEHTVHVGVFETDDEVLADRLRACADPDLFEVGEPAKAAVRETDPNAPPAGMSVPTTLEWVGGDAERARAALEAEKAGQNRATLIARLEGVLGA